MCICDCYISTCIVTSFFPDGGQVWMKWITLEAHQVVCSKMTICELYRSIKLRQMLLMSLQTMVKLVGVFDSHKICLSVS